MAPGERQKPFQCPIAAGLRRWLGFLRFWENAPYLERVCEICDSPRPRSAGQDLQEVAQFSLRTSPRRVCAVYSDSAGTSFCLRKRGLLGAEYGGIRPAGPVVGRVVSSGNRAVPADRQKLPHVPIASGMRHPLGYLWIRWNSE